jgi:hypothetical protein
MLMLLLHMLYITETTLLVAMDVVATVSEVLGLFLILKAD